MGHDRFLSFLCLSRLRRWGARAPDALLFSIPVHDGSGVTSLVLPSLVVPLCQMNSIGHAHSPFPILEPLHGQPSELLPEGKSLLDGEQMG